MKNIRFALPLSLALLSCSQQPAKEQDPLQNTKKLVKEGHATLYENGAFPVPATTIYLIPAGPDAIDLALELAGMRASQSFQESLKHASEAAEFAKRGMAKSEAAAIEMQSGTQVAAGVSRGITRQGASAVSAAPTISREVIAASVTFAGDAYTATAEAGENLAESAKRSGRALSAATDTAASGVLSGSARAAGRTSRASAASAHRHAAFAAERFVTGTAAIPQKLGARGANVAESAKLDNFVAAFQRSENFRGSASENFTDIVVQTGKNYSSDVARSFDAAGGELKTGASTIGYTLAMLKSLRWVLQGVLWDATIKPAGKLAGATLGYVTVNAVAFPTLVVVNEGVAVTHVAVQVVWNGAGAAYDITAPTATAAVAGLFSAGELIAGQTLAGGELVAGSTAAAGIYGAGKVGAAATTGGGVAAGKTVQYVGAPLSTLGVAAGGSAVGVVAGGVTAAYGATMVAGGVASEATVQVVGDTAAATVAIGGSAASVAAGTALGAYELSKAVVVPTGYTLGGGLVLSYGTLSQLSAQSLLAVSDAAYVVLSLEGPRWVLYAVKGNIDKGDNLPTGVMLDLGAMQQNGETFYRVPVSDADMQRVVDSVHDQLPVKRPEYFQAPPGE